jgi:hypothetical protein
MNGRKMIRKSRESARSSQATESGCRKYRLGGYTFVTATASCTICFEAFGVPWAWTGTEPLAKHGLVKSIIDYNNNQSLRIFLPRPDETLLVSTRLMFGVRK